MKDKHLALIFLISLALKIFTVTIFSSDHMIYRTLFGIASGIDMVGIWFLFMPDKKKKKNPGY